MRIEEDERRSTLKVRGGAGAPEVAPSDFWSDSRARTRELLDVARRVVVGPWWAWFWGSLLAAALVVIGILAVSRGREPALETGPPVMVCLYGKARIADGPLARWRKVLHVPAGVRASTSGPRSNRVVLNLAHDSSLRWQGRSEFSWQAGADGKPSLTVEQGRAWIALSPLDTLRVNFPDGWAELAPGTVAELNLRPRPPSSLVLRCRSGQVKAQLRRAHSSQSGREVQTVLVEGEGVQVLKDNRVQGVSHFNANDVWQQWNLALPGPATQ